MPFFSNYFNANPEAAGDAGLAHQVPRTQVENGGLVPQVPDAQMEDDGPSGTSEGVRRDPSILAIDDDIFTRDGDNFKAACR
jgi:hypothetical protein